MPSTQYDTACQVALPTGFYTTLQQVHATAAEALSGHVNSVCVLVWKHAVFPRLTKGRPWICCYVKQYFIVGVDIRTYLHYLLIITYFCHTSNIVLITKRCVGYTFIDKMVAYGKCSLP